MTRLSRRNLITTASAAMVAASVQLPLARAARAQSPGKPAPEFVGLENWINSDPLTIQSLRGRIVLVDFWTFGCSNCINTLPSMVKWHGDLGQRGLTIVGVHTPEFPFERELSALQKAVRRHGIEYAVAQDNAYQTWRAYETRYWPTSIIVDRDGQIVKYHEGDQGLDQLGQDIEAALG